MKSVKNTLTEWKLLLKRVKIIPKWVKITPKRVKITPIEWISLFGEAHRGTALLFRAVPLCVPPESEIYSIGVIFTLFGVIFTHFGMIFTCFESEFHSVRVFLTLFTLLKSNHFTLFTLREYGVWAVEVLPFVLKISEFFMARLLSLVGLASIVLVQFRKVSTSTVNFFAVINTS